MGITAKEVIGLILFIGLLLFLKFFGVAILMYGYHYAIGIFSCDSQIGGVCDIKTTTETCEEKGLHTCQEKCWGACGDNRKFRCDSEIGGACDWDPTNCPIDMISCNNTCWPKCTQGTFSCKSNGGNCTI